MGVFRFIPTLSEIPDSEATIERGRPLEVDCAMTPAPPADISTAFSEMGGIGNAIVWSPFTNLRTPKVFIDLVWLVASMDLGRLYRCLAQGVRLISVDGGIIAVEAIVVLALPTCFFSGKRRRDSRVAWWGHGPQLISRLRARPVSSSYRYIVAAGRVSSIDTGVGDVPNVDARNILISSPTVGSGNDLAVLGRVVSTYEADDVGDHFPNVKPTVTVGAA